MIKGVLVVIGVVVVRHIMEAIMGAYGEGGKREEN